MSDLARPTEEDLNRLEEIIYSWEDEESTRQILDEWYNLDGQAAAAELRFKALGTWHRWGSGSDLSNGDAQVLAKSTIAADPEIAKLFELAVHARTVQAPRSTAVSLTIDLHAP